ncbi:MAG TPA: DUF6295 family protein [Tepidiformaceae bacterium]|nr:DUF6295 family protein [Tepidiformaceae bacterium]
MCTMIAERTEISGSARGAGPWWQLDHLYLSYDHPYHIQLEHALNLDFVNEATGARIALELSLDDARALAARLTQVVAKAEAYEAQPVA